MQTDETRAREVLRTALDGLQMDYRQEHAAIHAMLAFANPAPTLSPDLAALIRRNTVAGGFANTVAIAEEAFEMGVKSAAPPAVEREELFERAERAWQRFFYPANDCFDTGPAADKLPFVDLEVADCLRLILAHCGFKVHHPEKRISYAMPERAVTLHPSDREAIAREESRVFRLEWIAAARPPVHPDPMKGRQCFDSFEGAVSFMGKQAEDATFVSLTEIINREIDRSPDAILALSGSLAPEGGVSAPSPGE